MFRTITKGRERYRYASSIFSICLQRAYKSLAPVFPANPSTSPLLIPDPYSLCFLSYTSELTSWDMNCTMTASPMTWRCSSRRSNWLSSRNLARRAQSSTPLSTKGFKTGYWATISTRGVAIIVIELIDVQTSLDKDNLFICGLCHFQLAQDLRPAEIR